jgi:hypothetical protein
MLRRIGLLALGALAVACLNGAQLHAQQPAQTEPRVAFVVGNAAYGRGALPSALNDAGLVAEALRSIGFEIVEGADLGQAELVRAYREFLAKVQARGPDTLAFVYFSGHALSFDGENFLLGVDARLARDSDIPIETVRLADLLGPFADSPARAKVMVIDAARPLPFQPQGRALARGLDAVDPPKGVLVAFSSAPGTVAPDRPGDYGAYATAIAEMLRAPGTDLETAFTHIRSRTHLTTEGQQTPWHASALGEPIELLPPQAATAGVPPPPPIRQGRPMREIGPDEAYALAIEMDTLEGYTAFVQAYPGHPYTQRVWAMVRARREALAWMRAREINTPPSYWTYLRRYPNGMYAFDAERRLRRLGQPFAPPAGFAMMEFDDVPMALSGEPVQYEEVYRVGPPPPRGIYLAPRPAYLVNLPPPQRRDGGGGGMRVLPGLAIAIPAVAALAPAPRRAFAPGAGPGRPGGFGERGRFGNRPAPVNVAPNQAVAPSTVSPSPGVASPGVGPGGRRPPGAGPPNVVVAPGAIAPNAVAPGAVAPGVVVPGAVRPDRRPPGGAPPPGLANRTPPAAPGAVAPNQGAPLQSKQRPGPQNVPGAGRPPMGGPPPGIARRTPPSGPPPQPSVSPAPPPNQPGQAKLPPQAPPPQMRQPPPRPAPAVVARPTPPAAPAASPPPRPAAPVPAAAAAAKQSAPPPPGRPPACPPGKVPQVVNGQPVCK